MYILKTANRTHTRGAGIGMEGDWKQQQGGMAARTGDVSRRAALA